MMLEVLLPFRLFLQKLDVLRIVAETTTGSVGLLPRRLDCVAILVPGILIFETAADGEIFVAVDVGVLVKTGADVRVTVRRAILGSELTELRTAVEREFLTQNAEARDKRAVLSKLETGFVARMAKLQKSLT